MKKELVSFIFLFVSVHALSAVNTCDVNKEFVGARYEITRLSADGKQSLKSYFNLWRRPNQVAHENVTTKVTDIWDHVVNGKVKPSRYFDEYERGIEYQAEDINKGKGDTQWAIKNQLVTDELFGILEKVTTEGKGCNVVETYKDKHGVLLEWMPSTQLVKRYSETSKNGSITWLLAEVVKDKAIIDSVYTNRERYKTTDYIDIGDNESDPFLMKLIHLGFIDHSASGFYDAEGHALNGADHHGH